MTIIPFIFLTQLPRTNSVSLSIDQIDDRDRDGASIVSERKAKRAAKVERSVTPATIPGVMTVTNNTSETVTSSVSSKDG